ncbi:MAG: DNA polymerase III subunit delta [Kiritimatiellia bacterium]
MARNFHVIIGEDDYLVSETAKKLIGDAGPALEVIDSNTSTNAELQLRDVVAADASFSTPPFLDPVKVTWWKNVKFLPCGGKGGPSDAVKEALEKFAKKVAASSPLPDTQRFILSGPKLLQSSVFAKTLKEAAEISVFAGGKPWEQARTAVVRVMDLAAGMNLAFDRGVADLFVARVGTDSRSLMSELGKIRDFLGPGCHTITAETVQEISSPGVGVEPEVWAITDALGARDLDGTLQAVRRFEQENGFAVMVTTVVERFFRQLTELKDAQAKDRLDAVAQGQSPFAVKKNLGFLRNWSLGELRVARARFLTLREKVVSSSGSADVLVLTELVRVCRRPVRGDAR